MDPRRRLAIGWLAAWLAVGLLAASISGRWLNFYLSMGVELPWITTLALFVGDSLRGPFGWLVLNAVLVIGILPLRLGVGGAAHRRWLALGLVQAPLAALLLWGAFELPRLNLQKGLVVDEYGFESSVNGPPADLGQAVAYATIGVAPTMLALAFLQLTSWLILSREVLGLTRASPGIEAARALVLAAVPALCAGFAAHLVALEVRAAPSTGLLVHPSLAAAGTAALLTYGVMLWLRLRRAPGEA